MLFGYQGIDAVPDSFCKEKIVQIISHGGNVLALTNEGNLYVINGKHYSTPFTKINNELEDNE